MGALPESGRCIDHILVDEAQDTTPAPMDVIERLRR